MAQKGSAAQADDLLERMRTLRMKYQAKKGGAAPVPVAEPETSYEETSPPPKPLPKPKPKPKPAPVAAVAEEVDDMGGILSPRAPGPIIQAKGRPAMAPPKDRDEASERLPGRTPRTDISSDGVRETRPTVSTSPQKPKPRAAPKPAPPQTYDDEEPPAEELPPKPVPKPKPKPKPAPAPVATDEYDAPAASPPRSVPKPKPKPVGLKISPSPSVEEEQPAPVISPRRPPPGAKAMPGMVKMPFPVAVKPALVVEEDPVPEPEEVAVEEDAPVAASIQVMQPTYQRKQSNPKPAPPPSHGRPTLGGGGSSFSTASAYTGSQSADLVSEDLGPSYGRKPPVVKGPPPAHLLARMAPPAEEAMLEEVAAPVPTYTRKPPGSKPPPPASKPPQRSIGSGDGDYQPPSMGRLGTSPQRPTAAPAPVYEAVEEDTGGEMAVIEDVAPLQPSFTRKPPGSKPPPPASKPPLQRMTEDSPQPTYARKPPGVGAKPSPPSAALAMEEDIPSYLSIPVGKKPPPPGAKPPPGGFKPPPPGAMAPKKPPPPGVKPPPGGFKPPPGVKPPSKNMEEEYVPPPKPPKPEYVLPSDMQELVDLCQSLVASAEGADEVLLSDVPYDPEPERLEEEAEAQRRQAEEEERLLKEEELRKIREAEAEEMAKKLNFNFTITESAVVAKKNPKAFDTDFDAMLAGLQAATADLDDM